MAVEVKSYLPDGPRADHHRLIHQGASIVRYTNVSFNAYKEKKNFGFVAVIINDIGIADRYSGLLYLKKTSFESKKRVDRMKFALELHILVKTFNQLVRSRQRTKPPTRSDGGKEPGSSGRGKGIDKGVTKQLEPCEYEMKPDVFKAESDTWELLSKVEHRNHFSMMSR